MARCSKVWCGCVGQPAYCIVGTQTASAIMIGLHELMSHTVHECLVQGVYVLYCTRVFGAECHIQFKSDMYRVFMLYAVKMLDTWCICHVLYKSL